jgi:hypothetical protein
MSKPSHATPSGENPESATTAATSHPDNSETPAVQSYWRLKASTAPKLGLRAEGGISYHILADTDRQNLFIGITGNDSGGYFSRELVPMQKILSCLDKCEVGMPFPSKTFKEAFTGRSSNNSGFLVAVLRAEKLLAAAPDAETQHQVSGDWAAWKEAMLAETGTVIELGSKTGNEKPAERAALPDHKEHKKTLTLPRKKSS